MDGRDYLQDIAATAQKVADFIPPISDRIAKAVKDRDEEKFILAVQNLDDVGRSIGRGLGIEAYFEFKENVIEGELGTPVDFPANKDNVKAVFEWVTISMKLFNVITGDNPIVWNIAQTLSDQLALVCDRQEAGADWLMRTAKNERTSGKSTRGERYMNTRKARFVSRKADVVHPSDEDLQKAEDFLEAGQYFLKVLPPIYDALMDAFKEQDDEAFYDAMLDLAQPGHKYPDIHDTYRELWDIVSQSTAQVGGTPPPNTLSGIISHRDASKDLWDFWRYAKESFHSKEYPAQQEYIEGALNDLKKDIAMLPNALRWLETWLLRYDTEKAMRAIRRSMRITASKANDVTRVVCGGISKAIEEQISTKKIIFSLMTMDNTVTYIEPVEGTDYVVETYGVFYLNAPSSPYVINAVFTLCMMLRPENIARVDEVEDLLPLADTWLGRAQQLGFSRTESDADMGLFANEVFNTDFRYSHMDENGDLSDEDVVADIIDDISTQIVVSMIKQQEEMIAAAKQLVETAAAELSA